MFHLFTFNIIIYMFGFRFTRLLFVFPSSHLLLFLSLTFRPYFDLIEYILEFCISLVLQEADAKMKLSVQEKEQASDICERREQERRIR